MLHKLTPEDFIVKEVPNRVWKEQGTYWVYRLTKRDATTQCAVQELARRNHVLARDIRYAGLKDKRAITTQYITSAKQLISIPEQVTVEHVGFTDEHLHLGDLEANRFHIIVREVQQRHEVTIPNYFGNQRFSTNNVEIGVLLLTKKFEQAAQYFAQEYAAVQKHLDKEPRGYITALQKVPQKILLLYVHAVQSALFNTAVSEWIKDTQPESREVAWTHGILRFPKTLPEITVPLMGAAQDLGMWEKYYAPQLEELGLNPQSFLVRALPFLTLEGTTRSLRCHIQDVVFTQQTEDVYEVQLTLGSGSYATVCLDGWFD